MLNVVYKNTEKSSFYVRSEWIKADLEEKSFIKHFLTFIIEDKRRWNISAV